MKLSGIFYADVDEKYVVINNDRILTQCIFFCPRVN
jgi:hypothetical protein